MARLVTLPALPKGDFLDTAGTFLAKVKSVDNSDPEYYKWVFEVIAGPCAGQTIQMRNYLNKESLWALRRTLECLGVKVPNSAFRIDLDALVGRKLVIVCDYKTDRRDPSKKYLNVVDMALASTWEGEQPKADPAKDTTQFIDGDEEEDEEEVPDVLKGPQA